MQLLVGFLGGLMAIVLKGAVDLYFERRRRRQAAISAARLVAEHAAQASARMQAAFGSVLDASAGTEKGTGDRRAEVVNLQRA